MKPPQQHYRVNLAEPKAQIIRKLGPERSKQYFYYLNKFLSLKLSKVEFNKLCLKIVGRESIPLHNQFIRAILKNACSAKAPPPASTDEILKGKTGIPSDGYMQNGNIQTPGSPGWSNDGDILQVSPRKARTSSRVRTAERRSALGPNGKTSVSSQHPTSSQSTDFNVSLENGDLIAHHYQAKQENETLSVKKSPDGPISVYSKDQTGLLVRDDSKEVSARSPLRAPLGLPLCSVSAGGARTSLPTTSSTRYLCTYDDGALPDSLTLRERMEQIATGQGLEGVSVDSANILNHGLDCYLKGLIRSCMVLVGGRSSDKVLESSGNKQQAHMKLINGVRPGHQHQIQLSRPLDVHEQKTCYPISLHDFRIAMEMKPQQLGEDWPLLLEKICLHSSEE